MGQGQSFHEHFPAFKDLARMNMPHLTLKYTIRGQKYQTNKPKELNPEKEHTGSETFLSFCRLVIDWSLVTREATIWFLRGQQTEQGNTGRSTGVLIPGGSSPEPWCGGLAGIKPHIDTVWKRLCATPVNCWAGTGGPTRGVLTVTLCCKIINNKINRRALRGQEVGWLPRLPLGLS